MIPVLFRFQKAAKTRYLIDVNAVSDICRKSIKTARHIIIIIKAIRGSSGAK